MPEKSDRPILIIDSMNLFIRSYAAYPQMSQFGYQMGGCIGFLKKVKYLVDELQPRRVYVVWESGGSTKRRALYKEYKRGRRPVKLNRFYEDDIPDTDENKVHQTQVLVEVLKSTPICQLYAPDCEADDVMAWLCRGKFLKVEKIIASSDKDMYQLLDERTRQYSLDKKKLITMEDVYSEFHVMPWNFALAKTLCGDVSDNIPGVKGIGFKTAVKKIPMLATHQDLILQDIIDYCQSHAKDGPVLQRINESTDQLKLNWRLVHLDSSSLTARQSQTIEKTIKEFKPQANKVAIIRTLLREGIQDFNVDSFLYTFTCLEGFNFVTR